MKKGKGKMKRRQQRTGSMGQVNVRNRPLAALGKLTKRKQQVDVQFLKAGKQNLLAHSVDHPVATLPFPHESEIRGLVQKMCGVKEEPDFFQRATYKVIHRKPGSNGSSSGSLLFHSNPEKSGTIKISNGKIHVTGCAKPNRMASFAKGSFVSTRTVASRARSVSTASTQSVSSLRSSRMSRKWSQKGDDCEQVFYLSRLFCVKHVDSSPHRVSLVFYSDKNSEGNKSSTSGWIEIPEFSEVLIKSETPEMSEHLLEAVLRHSLYFSNYLYSMVKQFNDNVVNNRVDFDSEKGKLLLKSNDFRLRLALDLVGIALGHRSKQFGEKCVVLSQFIKTHGDTFEEAGFWSDVSKRIEKFGDASLDATSQTLADLRKSLQEDN